MNKISRARVLAVAGLALVTALAGCTSKGQSSKQAKVAPGQLNIAYEADATSLDPGQVTDINTMHVLVQVYDTLVRWGPSGQLTASLATSWVESPNGLKYTFTLRKGVRFSDGTALTAKDVAFSFNRMLQDKVPGAQYGPFPFGKFFYGEVANVKALTVDEVEFDLSSADAGFLQTLTTPTAEIVNSALALRLGKTFALQGGGTGAFTLARWQRGSQLVLKPNPHYWGSKTSLRLVAFIPVTDASQRVTDLQAGTVSLAVSPQPSSVPKLKKSGYSLAQAPGPHVWWIGLNVSKPPLNKPLVRQAMNYAIDRNAIVNGLLYGTATASSQPISAGLPGHAPQVTEYKYNPAKAKELLKQAGYANGFSVKLFAPTSGSGMQDPVGMGTAIQAYLAAVGIKVKISEYDWGTYLNKVNAGAAASGMDMWELSWMNTAVDPSLILGPLFSKSSWPPGFNSGFYYNPQVDKALSDGLAEKNPTARMALYQKASQMINGDAPWIFVDNGKAVYALNSQVHGLTLSKSMPFILYNLNEVTVQ